MPRPPKRVKDSSIDDQTYKVFPNDLNGHYTVFGGLVMSLADRIASVVAERHAEMLCVTASVDSISFLAPAGSGDILVFKAAVNRCWRSSMEIGVKVVAENYHTGEKKHLVSAYFTFVAVDKNRKPSEVPPIVPETDDEKRRFEEAGMRRTHRQNEANERAQLRARWKKQSPD